jgi:hypothetical protein
VGELGEGTLDSLVSLFDDPGLLPAEKRPLARARQVSQGYLVHFQHAVPFDRRALEAVWRECPNEACTLARQQLEVDLGPLDGVGS